MRKRKNLFKPYTSGALNNRSRTKQSGTHVDMPVQTRIRFVTPTCPICHEPIPPSCKRESACDKCWLTKGDGRATSRTTPVTVPHCTKCKDLLDLVAEPTYRRCRRCREETLREQRAKGVAPSASKGTDPLCSQCRQVMIDDKFPNCVECQFGPRFKNFRSPKATNNRQVSPSASGPSGPSSSSSAHFPLPDHSPAVSSMSYLSAPSAGFSDLSLTPLSVDGTIDSNSSYTSYHNTPYSPHPNLPLSHPDSSVYSAGHHDIPLPYLPAQVSRRVAFSTPLSSVPLPHALPQLNSPVAFTTPLSSVPLPDSSIDDYSFNGLYPPHEAYEDNLSYTVDQHLLLRNSVCSEESQPPQLADTPLPPVGFLEDQPVDAQESLVAFLNSQDITPQPQFS